MVDGAPVEGKTQANIWFRMFALKQMVLTTPTVLVRDPSSEIASPLRVTDYCRSPVSKALKWLTIGFWVSACLMIDSLREIAASVAAVSGTLLGMAVVCLSLRLRAAHQGHIGIGFGYECILEWLAPWRSSEDWGCLEARLTPYHRTLHLEREEIKACWEQCPKAKSNPWTAAWTLGLC